MNTELVPQTDTPIRSGAEDRLGREQSAKAFASSLLHMDATEGVVVGLLGAWGAGKTSFMNLARPHLEAEGWTVVDFNPWLFSGLGQLVDSFFAELSGQLRSRDRFRDLADALAEYGAVFASLTALPGIGPWMGVAEAVGKQVRREVQKRTGGIKTPQDKVRALMSKVEAPIAVVIDDLDRLPTKDVREIFKLVRLTASFPNLIYILAFDRWRVELALAEDGVSGRDYLEKILFWSLDLPVIRPEVLGREVFVALDAALSDVAAPGPFQRDEWADVFAEIVRPLIRHIRDVRRYAVAVRASVLALKGEIALTDVLALEAIRVFLPDVFTRLTRVVGELTTPSGVVAGVADPPRVRLAIDAFIESAAPHQDVAQSLIRRIFPAAQRHLPQGSHYSSDWTRRWLRGRRVAHADFLRLYLERVAGASLTAFAIAERAATVLSDRVELGALISSLDPSERIDVVMALENWEDEFAADAVIPASIVLLNSIPDLPETDRGLFALAPEMVVTRVVLRLLRSLPDPGAIRAAVSAILPHVEQLSGRLALLLLVGHVEHAGHGLISVANISELEATWRKQVRAARARDLEHEWDLLRVLYQAQKQATTHEPVLRVPRVESLTLAIFRAAAGRARRQTLGNRAVHQSTRLAWSALVELFGNEREIMARLKVARRAAPRADEELLKLVERYVDGWRPKDFDPLDEDAE